MRQLLIRFGLSPDPISEPSRGDLIDQATLNVSLSIEIDQTIANIGQL